MRVLHVDTGKEWRGGQRQALLLHRGLIEQGVESFLAANSHGALIKKCENNIVSYGFKGEVSPVSLWNIIRIIKKIKPDIVHSHDAHSLTPLILAKIMRFKFKLVHTRRVDFSIRKNRLSKFKYDNRYIDKIVAISEAVKKVLVSDGIDESKIEVIYSGVEFKNPDDYECPSDLKPLLDGYKVIGCVANFADHKDHKTLIKAFNKVYEIRKDVKLLLVGDGPLFYETLDFAKKYPCFNNIVFTGFREDVYSCLKCIDIFAMTSKEEGLCTSIIDALSFGLPVVATKAGGIPEIVKDGINGYLAEVKNSSKIAELFLYSLDSKFNKNNLIYSVKEFSFEKMTFNYKKIYKRIMG
ncbi:glycosyltransferase [Deferribacter thermophilus]|uniref:glycosyltransferase n=1 Tax=Deferribacter thermophilus TaxID=53573 RepID=UPI003C2AA6A4